MDHHLYSNIGGCQISNIAIIKRNVAILSLYSILRAIFSEHLISNIAITLLYSISFPRYIRFYGSSCYLISNIAILSPCSFCQIPSKFDFTGRRFEVTYVNSNLPP